MLKHISMNVFQYTFRQYLDTLILEILELANFQNVFIGKNIYWYSDLTEHKLKMNICTFLGLVIVIFFNLIYSNINILRKHIDFDTINNIILLGLVCFIAGKHLQTDRIFFVESFKFIICAHLFFMTLSAFFYQQQQKHNKFRYFVGYLCSKIK